MLLDTARKRLRKKQNMSYNVTVKTIPERYAATVHTVIPRYEDEGMAWNMMNECQMPLVPTDPCLAATEFLDKEYKEENVGIAVMMYFLNLIASIAEVAEFLKYITPFGYCEGADIISNGSLDAVMVSVGMVLCVGGIAVAYLKYTRKDIHS